MNPYLKCLSDKLLSDVMFYTIENIYAGVENYNMRLASFDDIINSTVSIKGMFIFSNTKFKIKFWSNLNELIGKRIDNQIIDNYEYGYYEYPDAVYITELNKLKNTVQSYKIPK